MTGATVHSPERTCVGCRQRDRQSALVRVVRDDGPGQVRLDPRRRLPGRGAYVHLPCIDLALKRGAIARGLKTAVSTDAINALREQLTELAGSHEPMPVKEHPQP